MYSSFQLFLCSLIASAVSATVSNVLWIRHHRRVCSLLERDLRDLWEEMDEPPLDLSPEDRMVLATMRDYWQHPSRFELVREESAEGLHVTVRRKEATPDA